METELATLANAGATALVRLMVSDSWIKAKDGFAHLFRRSGTTTSTLRRLETSQDQLLAAHAEGDHAEKAVIEDEWRTRLYHLLRSDPEAREELRCLLNLPGCAGPVYNINSGSVRFGSVIQAGQITGAAVHITPTPDEQASERQDEREPRGRYGDTPRRVS